VLNLLKSSSPEYCMRLLENRKMLDSHRAFI
jgi:hypothetical protein